MIHSLNGTLIYTDVGTAVIECGGVGFSCSISMNTLKKLPPVGSNIIMFTHLNVREDALDLFGFSDSEELKMFRLITTVSGVGPKIALSILSELEPSKLVLAIASGDTKTISRANGVGAKMAQRICLELKDKIGGTSVADSGISAIEDISASQNARDAVEVLVSLGYSQSESSSAVSKIDSSLPTEEIIKKALAAVAKKL